MIFKLFVVLFGSYLCTTTSFAVLKTRSIVKIPVSILVYESKSRINILKMVSDETNEDIPRETMGDPFGDVKTRLKGTCIYFIGMMGSGKSTVGDILARKLGYRFLNTDEIAELMIEMPIANFFEQGMGLSSS